MSDASQPRPGKAAEEQWRNHRYMDGDEHEVRTWFVPRLWELARELPVEEVPTTELLIELERAYSVREIPNCMEMARHSRRTFDADLSHPIILAPDGKLMDGSHRIAKAWITGSPSVRAVRFREMPEPDLREPAPAAPNKPAEGQS
jgi:hypothetical protein